MLFNIACRVVRNGLRLIDILFEVVKNIKGKNGALFNFWNA